METDRLSERIAEFARANAQLAKACSRPKDEFIRDAVIQRFEFTYELAWKMLKLKLAQEGVAANTPRETLQEALRAGFIADGNTWSELQRMRNLTSHTYDETLAEQVDAFIRTKARALFDALEAISASWSRHP
jgi:nucleotidyltransferase substrate binding protein (TIGR01987 family)